MEGKPWFAHYDEGVPKTLAPYPQRTLLDYVASTAAQEPAHPALLFEGREVTYDEIERLSNAFAAALMVLGCQRGDRLALLLPNCPQFVIAELGAWKAGALVVPLNPLLSARELTTLLGDCGAETLVVLTPFYAQVKAIQPHTAVKRVITTGIEEYLPYRKTDLIKTSGYQVWPREIEDVIAAHPAVADVGVAGVPDPVKGEVAKAWVVLRPGTSTTAGDIRAYCREHLAPYKVPAAVELRDALPKTLLVGKVLRRKLVEESGNGQQAEHRP